MNLHNLTPANGYVKKTKRIARGQGSGHGGTSTRGHKGAKSRSGYSTKIGFEGGQMPLQRRVPKFGFKNINRVEYKAINLDIIQSLVERKNVTEITPDILRTYGILSRNDLVKVLGSGEIKSSLEVHANKFSDTAKSAIEGAGGSVHVIEK